MDVHWEKALMMAGINCSDVEISVFLMKERAAVKVYMPSGV